MLFRCQGEEVHPEAKSLSVAAKPHIHRQEKVLRKASFPRTYSSRCALAKASRIFRWRCAQGRHPFSSRTRWLRPGRPMILYWRRYGKAGGCRIKWGLSSVGRAPALQAGGREFESLSLHLQTKWFAESYLENRISKIKYPTSVKGRISRKGKRS